MWIHARLQSARVGQSRCPFLLVTVTYLLDYSQNQRRAQTLQHRAHSEVFKRGQRRARTGRVEEEEAISQQ